MSLPFPPSCLFFLRTGMSILLYRTTASRSVHHRLSAITLSVSGHGHDHQKWSSCNVDVGMSRIMIMTDTRISMPTAMYRYDRWYMAMGGWMVHGYVLHPWMSPHIPRDPFPNLNFEVSTKCWCSEKGGSNSAPPKSSFCHLPSPPFDS